VVVVSEVMAFIDFIQTKSRHSFFVCVFFTMNIKIKKFDSTGQVP